MFFFFFFKSYLSRLFSDFFVFHCCLGRGYLLDCFQSAFSLKIRLVLDLIQRDCNPRCCYIDETIKDGCLLFFLLGLTPSFLAASGFATRVLRFCVQ